MSRPLRELPTVLGASAAFGAVFFDRFAPLFILLLITDDLPVRSGLEGTLAFLMGLAWAAAMIPARRASRHWSHRRRILLGATLAGVLSLASAFATSWLAFIALKGAATLAAGTTAPAITGLLFAAAPPARRGRDIGIVIAAPRVGGNLLAPVAVTAVAVTWGWRPAIVLSAAVALLGAALLAVLVPAQAAPAATRGAARRRPRLHPGGRRQLVGSTVGCIVVIGWIVVFSQSSVPLVADWLALSTDGAGRVAGAFGIGAALSTLAVPTLSDRLGRAPAVAAGALVGGTAGAAVAAGAATGAALAPAVVATLMFLAGAASGVMPLVISVIPGETVADGDPGYAVAWPTALGEIFGGAAMPVAAAAAAVQVGLPAVFGAAALGVVLLGLVALPLLRPDPDLRAVRSG